MKTFKIKDLVVSLETDKADAAQPHCGAPSLCHTPSLVCPTPTIVVCPTHTICANPTLICANQTLIHCGGCSILFCSHLPSLIPVTTTITIWKTTTPVQTVVHDFNKKELADFKAQLGELQKFVEKATPKSSTKELDLLEKKLNEAIEEVRAQKAQAKGE